MWGSLDNRAGRSDNKLNALVFQMRGELPMRLVIEKDGGVVDELRFSDGPIYIGRHTNSQVFLADRTVSRQHAVLYATQEGKWIIEDLDSANKTSLNDKEIHKAEVKTGDIISIADFRIEINLEKQGEEGSINLEDTLIHQGRTTEKPQVIVRKLDKEHAPSIKFPAKRAKHFAQATEAICSARGLDEMILALLTILLRQFSASHSWCALRDEPDGPMLSHAGKAQDGIRIKLDDLKLKDRVNEAIEKKHFLLLPRLPFEMEQQKLRSAIIAPVMNTADCFGVLYVDNSTNHEHYETNDLDYLMFIAVHTAAIVKNF